MAKQDVELKFSLIDGVSRSLGEIQKGVTGLGASLVKVNATADLTGKAFAGIKAAGNFLADQATGVGNFENSLASLQAVTGASADQLGKLKDAAIAASQSSIFSSTQAADGLTELARAGFDATESISALNPVLALAQGQQLEVGESTQFVTTTLTQFGLAASEAGRVADVLASAADKSSLDVRQLGQSLSYAAPIAKQVGLTLEETTAIIGKLADEGFRGERGGTALANVFTALIDPSSKFSKSLDDAGIKTRDFSEVMQALADKGEGATKILLTLDTTARPAITALASKGSAGIRELTKALSDSGGAAQRTADILGATFSATVQKFENNITNLRNAILTPILAPLSDEIQTLSDRLIAFSKSPEFDAIVANFTRIATEGLRILGDEIAKIDFTDALTKVIDFSTAFAENMAIIAGAVDIAARTIGGLLDVASITFESLRGVTASVAAAIVEPFAVLNSDLTGLWLSLRSQAADSEKSVGASLTKLGERFTGTAGAANQLDDAIKSSALSAKVAAGNYKALADALPKNDIVAIAERWGLVGKGLKEVGEGANKAGEGIDKARTAAIAASIAFERMQVGTLIRAMDLLRNAGLQTSDTYKALNAQFLAAEGRINALTAEQEKLANKTQKVEEKTRSATASLRDYAGAARDAGNSTREAADSIDSSGDSFGNIERQSSAVEISLGNITEAYARLAIEAAGASGSIRDYARVVSGFFAVAEEQDAKIADRIRLLNSLNATLDDEAQLRLQLEAVYGTSSVRFEELLQAELKQLNLRKESLEVGRQEIEQEKERQNLRGGFGTTAPAAPTTSASTGGRGSSTAAASSTSPINITINQNGATPENIRDLAPLIERELRQLGALRR